MKLRPYQEEAIQALFDYLSNNPGSPIISVATGGGKSIIQAQFIRRVLDSWPRERFLLLTHVKELLVQNAKYLDGLDVGFYSAGLGKRQTGHTITIAGIQSVYKRAHEMGDIGIVFIDECHLVSKNGRTMYRRFLADLRKVCPSVRVIGMSATPYRLDSGSLIDGDNRIFNGIAYNVGIKDLIEQGYLAPLRTATTKTHVNTDDVVCEGGSLLLVSSQLRLAA